MTAKSDAYPVKRPVLQSETSPKIESLQLMTCSIQDSSDIKPQSRLWLEVVMQYVDIREYKKSNQSNRCEVSSGAQPNIYTDPNNPEAHAHGQAMAKTPVTETCPTRYGGPRSNNRDIRRRGQWQAGHQTDKEEKQNQRHHHHTMESDGEGKERGTVRFSALREHSIPMQSAQPIQDVIGNWSEIDKLCRWC